MRKLARASVIVAAVSVASVLFAPMSLVALAAPGAPAASVSLVAASTNDAPQRTVGTLTLTPCPVLPHAWCGSIQRAWDPSGRVHGTVSVGFAFLPASDTAQPAIGTLVPHEGGPGYSTTGTAPDYAAMYGDLLSRRNLLLVDQRGTGLTAPINCPSLQHLVGAYAPNAAICAAKLGNRFDLYGSELSADDLSAVITALQLGPVDLYGDSYGTFFAQVFLGRHPGQLRSVVLDSAYPTSGEDAWYGTQGPALISSYEKVCERAPDCRSLGGSTITRLSQLLDVVRQKPLHARQTGADGKMHKVTVNTVELTYLAYAATFTTAIYREFDPALRAALAGDPAPIARLVAEQDFFGGDGPSFAYSEGLDAAVSCQDYPQLYDMSQPPAVRQQQYAAAVQAKRLSDPEIYAPFTLDEYLASGWGEQNWCLQWPVAAPAHVAQPPTPIGGHYAAVPTLVLSGELDTITTPAEGALVVAQIPGARQVLVANSTHVTAVDDTDGCGRALVQAFVAAPTAALPAADLQCAARVPPVRTAPSYAKSFASNGTGDPKQRAAQTAALTVADLTDRWQESIAGFGFGLRGGTWTSTGDRNVTFRLKGIRLAGDLAVSGTIVWQRYGHHATSTLHVTQVDSTGATVTSAHVNGTLTGSWDTRAAGARVHLTGTLGGQAVSYGFLAP
jgi:pimeloyl-ACP methyl ester carboxylesterase